MCYRATRAQASLLTDILKWRQICFMILLPQIKSECISMDGLIEYVHGNGCWMERKSHRVCARVANGYMKGEHRTAGIAVRYLPLIWCGSGSRWFIFIAVCYTLFACIYQWADWFSAPAAGPAGPVYRAGRAMKKSMSATRISTLDHGDSGQAGRFGPAAPSIILMHLRQRVSLAARDRKCSISDSEACVVYTCFDSAARVCGHVCAWTTTLALIIPSMLCPTCGTTINSRPAPKSRARGA